MLLSLSWFLVLDSCFPGFCFLFPSQATPRPIFRILYYMSHLLRKLFPFLICILTLVSCKKDNLGQEVNPDCVTTNVSFSSTISGIINTNCLSCHGYGNPSGGFSLTTYSGVKAKVDDGRLLGAVSHSPGYSPMPDGAPKLSQCDIAKIKSWIEAGALNN